MCTTRLLELGPTAEEMVGLFGVFGPAEYEAETKQRSGDTDAYAESNKSVNSHTKEDWLQLSNEASAINVQLLDLRANNIPANSAEAMAGAEEHRNQARSIGERPTDRQSVWSAFGPREDEKRPQMVPTSERRKHKGHKGFRRIVNVGCTP